MVSDIEVDYLLDLAELPAWSEIERLDTDHNGTITVAERDAYLTSLAPRLALDLRVDGLAVHLQRMFQTITAPPGQDGLSTLRIAITFRGALTRDVAVGGSLRVSFTDTTWSDRDGWREIDADPSQGYSVVASSIARDAPRAGPTLGYPTTPVRLPRDDHADFVFRRTDVPTSPIAPPHPVSRPSDAESIRLTRLIRTAGDRPSLTFVLFALAVAAGLGAAHALGPGHGKALAGAWLVGARARPRDALLLGIVVTCTHTAVVFGLAVVALLVERHFGTARLFRALEITSALLVMGVALRQLLDRWRALRAPTDASEAEHSHLPAGEHTLKALMAVGVSGGMVPCPSALVVLLTAVGLHRVALGIALLGAFSLGLAGMLVLVGLAALAARDRFIARTKAPMWARGLPLASSVAVLLLGGAMLLRGVLSE